MERQVISKVMWRLIPFMIFLYILNYIDRVNISFAKLMLKDDLKFDDAVYATGVSIFYIGYCLFEVPSNLIMERVGARVWMARIMISWGLITSAMMFINSKESFYALRVLLGIAEAGFFPGMVLYLTRWIPAKQRAQAGGLFLTSTALSGVVGSPLAGLIMRLDKVGDLRGWQWLFLLEGIPTIFAGIVILFYLDNEPKDAKWLEPEERDWLSKRLEAERGAVHGHGHHSLKHAFTSPRVWLLCFAYGFILLGFYCVHYWAPSIFKEDLLAALPEAERTDDAKNALNLTAGYLMAIVYSGATIGLVIFGRGADRTGNYRGWVIAGALLSFAGFAAGAITLTSTTLCVCFFFIAALGIFGTLGPFWALPPVFLSGPAAAAGIAFINSVGNLIGGLFGPQMMGQLKERTGSYEAGVGAFALVSLFAAVLTYCIKPAQPVHGDIAPGTESL